MSDLPPPPPPLTLAPASVGWSLSSAELRDYVLYEQRPLPSDEMIRDGFIVMAERLPRAGYKLNKDQQRRHDELQARFISFFAFGKLLKKKKSQKKSMKTKKSPKRSMNKSKNKSMKKKISPKKSMNKKKSPKKKSGSVKK